MKLQPIVYILALAAILQSCGGAVKNAEGANMTDDNASKQIITASQANGNLVVGDEKDLIGSWVGLFRPAGAIQADGGDYWKNVNTITVAIDEIKSGTVKGHSIVAGNYRPFTGTITDNESGFDFSVKEPGDNKYDGVFHFVIKRQDSTLTGTWKANNKLKITDRYCDLTKKMFRYNPSNKLSDYNQYVDEFKHQKDQDSSAIEGSYLSTTPDVNKYNASTDLLTTAQVADLKKADIFIMRNSIFARHGYSFKHKELSLYFEKENWYIPVSVNVESQLTVTEKKNLALLKRYEKNAEEYYDSFAR